MKDAKGAGSSPRLSSTSRVALSIRCHSAVYAQSLLITFAVVVLMLASVVGTDPLARGLLGSVYRW